MIGILHGFCFIITYINYIIINSIYTHILIAYFNYVLILAQLKSYADIKVIFVVKILKVKILLLFSEFEFCAPRPLQMSRGRRQASRGTRIEAARWRTSADSFSNPSRLIPGNHFPKTNLLTDSQTDETDGAQTKKRRIRCIWCNNRNRVEKRTHYICSLCNVPLCIEPCFEYYHSSD